MKHPAADECPIDQNDQPLRGDQVKEFPALASIWSERFAILPTLSKYVSIDGYMLCSWLQNSHHEWTLHAPSGDIIKRISEYGLDQIEQVQNWAYWSKVKHLRSIVANDSTPVPDIPAEPIVEPFIAIESPPVKKHIGFDKPVLKGFDLEYNDAPIGFYPLHHYDIKPGELTVLCAPTGTGKSMLTGHERTTTKRVDSLFVGGPFAGQQTLEADSELLMSYRESHISIISPNVTIIKSIMQHNSCDYELLLQIPLKCWEGPEQHDSPPNPKYRSLFKKEIPILSSDLVNTAFVTIPGDKVVTTDNDILYHVVQIHIGGPEVPFVGYYIFIPETMDNEATLNELMELFITTTLALTNPKAESTEHRELDEETNPIDEAIRLDNLLDDEEVRQLHKIVAHDGQLDN